MAQELLQVVIQGKSDLEAVTKRATESLNRLNTGVVNLGATARRVAVGPMTALTGALAAFASVQTLRSIFDVGVQAQRLENILIAVTGSSAGAAAEMAFLRAEAERLGLDFASISKGFAGLAAAAKQTSLGLAGARDIFTAVSEAATVLDLSLEDTQGILLALQKMISAGKVDTEGLREEVGGRLPGAFGLAAKAMNMTTQVLTKQLELGKVGLDFFPKFGATLRATYGPEVERAVQSANSAVLRFGNAWRDLRVRVAEGGFLQGAMQGMIAFTALLKDPAMLGAADRFGQFLAVTVPASAGLAARSLGWLAENVQIFSEQIGIGLTPLQQNIRDETALLERIRAQERQMQSLAGISGPDPGGRGERLLQQGQATLDNLRFQMTLLKAAQRRLTQPQGEPATPGMPPSTPAATAAADETAEAQKKIENAVKKTTDSLEKQRVGLEKQLIALRDGEEAALRFSVKQELDLIPGLTKAQREGFAPLTAGIIEATRALRQAEAEAKIFQRTVEGMEMPASFAEGMAARMKAFDDLEKGSRQSLEALSHQINDVFLSDQARATGHITRHWEQVREQLQQVAKDWPALADQVDVALSRISGARDKQLLESNRLVQTLDELVTGTFRGVTDAFTGAIEQGKELSDVFKNLGTSLLLGLNRAILQEAFRPLEEVLKGFIRGLVGSTASSTARSSGITVGKAAGSFFSKLIGNLIGGLFGGGGFTGNEAFEFARGGVVAGGVRPLNFAALSFPVPRYQHGGIVSQPQLALIGEGAMSEAIIPLPDNRSVPVKFQGPPPTQGGRVKVDVHVHGVITPARPGMSKEEVLEVIVENYTQDGTIRQMIQRDH